MATQWLSVLVGQFVFFSKFNSDVLIPRFIILECCAHYHASSVYCMFVIRVRFLKLVLRLMLQYFTVSNSALTFLKMFCDILCWFSDRFVMFLDTLTFLKMFCDVLCWFLKMFWHFWRCFVTFCVGFLVVLWCFLRAESRRCNMCSFNLTSINSKNLPVYNQLLGQ